MSVEYDHRMNHSLLNQLLDDEYRYQCPDCASHTIAVRNKIAGADQHKEREDTDGYHEPHVDPVVHVNDMRCEQCGATFNRAYDKKQGEQRSLRTEHAKIGGL